MLHLLQAKTINGVLRYAFRQTGFLSDQLSSMAARAKATCARCVAKKKRLSANKRAKEQLIRLLRRLILAQDQRMAHWDRLPESMLKTP